MPSAVRQSDAVAPADWLRPVQPRLQHLGRPQHGPGWLARGTRIPRQGCRLGTPQGCLQGSGSEQVQRAHLSRADQERRFHQPDAEARRHGPGAGERVAPLRDGHARHHYAHPGAAVDAAQNRRQHEQNFFVTEKGAQEFDFKDDTTAMADLKENAFGDWPLVNILVAEDSSGGIGVPCPPLCASLMPSPPLIGCALYSLVFSTWGGRSMVLDGLHVAPAYRGKGVGSALLRAVFKEAAQNKCNELTCHALTKSDAFINLMRRHGGMDQEREKGWHLFEMDKRAITMLTLEQPWTPLNTAASTSKS
ncbi:uncharacterized protein LOC119442328 isoform X3 [Dermacentor silvarum]|uniref:uncharacterized protein LOC119442328 isoform X3 n=1 Tax=Dermacentor silvarum TaxID=543639 RepID=UPI002101B7E0|nr:uncharacterized protein LOC119442328 isoform X3 [Dermacentor silvarum]